MKKRLIWRPNEIALDVWEAMPREEQIRWWKDRRQPPQPKPHMTRAITAYNEGAITQHGFTSYVTKLVVVEEIEEFVKQCPPELMEILKEQLSHYGPDESKWPRTFYMASYAPWVTPEEITESRRLEQEQIWSGVKLLKKHLPT